MPMYLAITRLLHLVQWRILNLFIVLMFQKGLRVYTLLRIVQMLPEMQIFMLNMGKHQLSVVINANQRNPQAGSWYVMVHAARNLHWVSLRATLTGTVLNNSTIRPITGTTGSQTIYQIDVLSDSTVFEVLTNGGFGSVGLFVSYGEIPTINSFQCMSYRRGTEESCRFSNPRAGRWYIMIEGHKAYRDVNLSANVAYVGVDGCNSGNCLKTGTTIQNLSGAKDSTIFYKMHVAAGAKLKVKMTGGSNQGDADLYVRAENVPNVNDYDCRPYTSGNNEACTISVTKTGYYHIMIRGYRAYNDLSLNVTY